jgi:hypothetical protein
MKKERKLNFLASHTENNIRNQVRFDLSRTVRQTRPAALSFKMLEHTIDGRHEISSDTYGDTNITPQPRPYSCSKTSDDRKATATVAYIFAQFPLETTRARILTTLSSQTT